MELITKWKFILSDINAEQHQMFSELFEKITKSCEDYNVKNNDVKTNIQPYEGYLIITLFKLAYLREGKIIENIFDIYLQIISQNVRDVNFYNRNNETKLIEELYNIVISSI